MARILQEKGLTTSPMGVIGVAAAGVVTVLMFLIISTADGVAKDEGIVAIERVWAITALYIATMMPVVKRLLAPLGRVYERAGRITPDLFAVFIGLALRMAALPGILAPMTGPLGCRPSPSLPGPRLSSAPPGAGRRRGATHLTGG